MRERARLVPRVGRGGAAPVGGRHGGISAGVKHWHGAAKDSWFSHIAVEKPGQGCSTEWLEPVSDEEYFKLG